MDNEPYIRFSRDELITRDYLAVDRTILANERTLLSYVRTALAFAAAGAALIHFFDSGSIEGIGWLMILFGIVILAVGGRRYIQMRQRFGALLENKGGKDMV